MKTKWVFISALVLFTLLVVGMGLSQAQPLCPDPYEPNDSLNEAWSLTAPTTIHSYLCGWPDVDYFSFWADAGDAIYLSLYDLPADYRFSLYDPSQSLITISGKPGTGPKVITAAASTSGSYYAYVYPFEGAYDDSNPYTLSIGEAPDLTVTDVWLEAGLQQLDIHYQVRNIGATEAISGHVTALSIDGQQEITHTVNVTLAVGERWSGPLRSWLCSGQEDVVRVCVDALDALPESDEANNCITETWKCDATPPVITSGPDASQVLQTSTVITWTTDEDSDGEVAFGQYAGVYESQEAHAGLTAEHTILLTGLQPATVYHYVVSSTDASGNTVTSDESFFETEPEPAGVPPSLGVPTIAQLEGNRELYKITVPVSDTAGVERVEFYLDDKLIGIDYSGEPLSGTRAHLNVAPTWANHAVAPLVLEFEITLDPPALDLSRDGFFGQQHMITTRAVNRGDLSNEKILSFEPEEQYLDECNVKVLWPPLDHVIYVDGSTVPAGTTLPIFVKTYATEWGFTEFQGRFVGWRGAIEPMKAELFLDIPPWGLFPPPDDVSGPSIDHEFTWDISGLGVGLYIYKVRAVDPENEDRSCWAHHEGNTLWWFRIAQGTPDLTLTRSVTWTANYFSVTLTLENAGTGTAGVSRIQDNVSGFQPVMTHTASYDVVPTYSVLFRRNTVDINLFSATGGAREIAPGESISVTYSAVPILYPDADTFAYGIGIADDVLVCDAADACRWHFDRPVTQVSLDEPLAAAHAASDYLIVTHPDNLYSHNTGNRSDVNQLLAKMAELAQLKEGILGYVSDQDAEAVRSTIQAWGFGMKGSDNVERHYLDNGYLLLVGEAEIIGSWDVYRGRDFGTVHYSDLPYGNTAGDYVDPELIVSRIIGNRAIDLLVPIETSINVHLDVPDYRFTKRNALLVSGRGDGHVEFEQSVDDIYGLLTEYGSHFHSGQVDMRKQRIVEDIEGLDVTQVFIAEIARTDGRDLLYYRDHCNSDEWTGVISVTTFPIDFMERKPLAFACCCQAGSYEDDDDVGIAETFMRSETPIYVGATQNSKRYANNIACRWFFDRWADRAESIGQSFRKLKIDLHGDQQDYWAAEYNLYGDPKYGTLPVYPTSMAAHNAQVEATESITSVEVVVPHYVVTTTLEGEHAVHIPGGDMLIEMGKPLVPVFRVEVPYPVGVRVQDVALTSRSGLEQVTGLVIPVAAEAWDTRSASPAASGGGDEWWPGPAETFDWRVREHWDGSSTLVIQVYPFYYNAQTTQVTFFENHSFDVTVVSSTVGITAFAADAEAYVPGDEVMIDLWLSNSGEAQDVTVSAVVRAEGSDEVVDGLLLRSLKGLTGTASFSPKWDSTGFEPGYYSVEAEVRDSTSNVLDTETRRFRLGVCSGQVASLAATPALFHIGDTVSTSLTFSNTGTVPITGTAVIQIKDETGETIETFRHEVTNLAPEDAVSLDDGWDTSGADRGSYSVIGYVLYDSRSAGPEVVIVGTETYIYLPLVMKSFSP
jgi:hypothetical protein